MRIYLVKDGDLDISCSTSLSEGLQKDVDFVKHEDSTKNCFFRYIYIDIDELDFSNQKITSVITKPQPHIDTWTLSFSGMAASRSVIESHWNPSQRRMGCPTPPVLLGLLGLASGGIGGERRSVCVNGTCTSETI